MSGTQGGCFVLLGFLHPARPLSKLSPQPLPGGAGARKLWQGVGCIRKSVLLKTVLRTRAFRAVLTGVALGVTVFMALSPRAAAQAQLGFAAALAGVESSPRVAVARAELELAQKQLDVNAAFFQGEVSGGYTRTFSNLETGFGTLDDNDLDPLRLTTVLNVVPYGPYDDRVARAQWAVLQAEAALRDAAAGAVVDVTEQYQAALRLEEEAAAARSELALAGERLAAARTGLEAGTVADDGVLAADLGVRQAELTVSTAERAQRQALAVLAVTLGRPVAALTGDPPPSVAVERTGVTDDLLARRSDVLSAALALREAELTAAATLRDNLPSGTLSAVYTNGNDGSNLQLGAQFSTNGGNAFQPTFSAALDPDTGLPGLGPGQVSSAFSVGLGLTIPLNAALDAALAAARANVESAQLRAAQTLALARLEATSRAADVAGALAQVSLARQSLDQQRQSLSVAQRRLGLGSIAPLEVRAAEVAVLEAELAQRRAEDALRLARLRYAAAMALDPEEVF